MKCTEIKEDEIDNDCAINFLEEREEPINSPILEKLRTRIAIEAGDVSANSLRDLTPTNAIEHEIRPTDNTPFNIKPRPVPFAKRNEFKQQDDLMINMLYENELEQINTIHFQEINKPECQKSDRDIAWFIEILRNNKEKPKIDKFENNIHESFYNSWDEFKLIGEVLYRIDKHNNNCAQFVVPSNERKLIMQQEHASTWRGHLNKSTCQQVMEPRDLTFGSRDITGSVTNEYQAGFKEGHRYETREMGYKSREPAQPERGKNKGDKP
ncbi:hypothetical protein BpHYR1_014352 [Brachionus plicatilis]|uniref:Uncharacterized protein n=1 Tax=Brachionus plicatilis TaxID=10195 RepID=A0A3M7QBF1_BRAPC|nr:hypothetical protein BpHYR1_014352 [Brachionus plicatilis]